ncbi:MAG TPA: hypothetical protein VND64_22505 [Pirellulales bacterium]|nr:hypothetical protein [Pirellulales bacterium]
MSNDEAVRVLRESLRCRRKPTCVIIDETRKPAKAVVTFDDRTAIAWCPSTSPRWFLLYWKKMAAVWTGRLGKPPVTPVTPWWSDWRRKSPRSSL